MRMVFRVLPDIGILMIVGTIPDYVQGLVKGAWLVFPGKSGRKVT